jgi:myo-inositol-1(or 4)-monophosphatase
LPARDIDAADLSLIESTVREAGKIARHYFGGEYKRWSKSKGEPVTEADLAIDKFLRLKLGEARDAYGWLSEETGADAERAGAARVFIVDPIDGTTAFLKEKPHFSISVAVVEKGEPVAGVVYNPITEECFVAASGGGASLNGTPVHVSACTAVAGCRMLGARDVFANPAWTKPPNTPWPEMLIETRSSIAYRMALVAGGQFDAALVLAPKHDWDMAAGDLIVREAGGFVTAHDGTRLRYDGAAAIQRSMVCAGPGLRTELLGRLGHIDLSQR